MSGERILVVDDSDELRTFLSQEVLPQCGYQTLSAAGGQQALRLIAREQPDLVLLDYQLPDISGLDVLTQLGRQQPAMPVILMTAHGSESIAVESFRLGASDYLVKPFDIELAVATIDRVLTQAHLQREKERLSRELEKARASLEQRVKELTVLFGVSKTVTSLLDLNQVLGRVVEAAVFVSRAEEGALWLLEPETGHLLLRANKGLGQPPPQQLIRLKAEDGLVQRTFQELRPVRLAAEAGQDGIEIKGGCLARALLSSPLLAKGQAIGILCVANRLQSRPFSANDEAMFQALADYAVIAIENAQVYEATDGALSRRVQELAYLYDIARTLTSTLEQGRVFDLVATRITEMFHVEAGSLLLVDEEASELEFVTTWLGEREPLRHIRLELGQGIAGQVALTHQPEIVNDAYSDNRFYTQVDRETGFLTRSILCVPLLLRDRCIGVIELLNKLDGPFTQDDVERLSNVAGPVAVALENARLYAEAQELYTAKSRFVATVARQLRTPLTAIKGYTDMLYLASSAGDPAGVGELGDTWTESLETIRTNTNYLISLMEDLLDIAWLEAGETHLQRTPVSPREFITQVVSSFEHRFRDKNLRVSVKVSSRLPSVDIDQERISQVLSSLLMNAYLYTLPKGRVTVAASTEKARARPSDAGWLAISVADTGIGISPEDVPQVFDHFFRADHPLVQYHSGRGLSLSIAQSLVELHGGRIWVESEAGVGSTFVFTVPFAQPTAQMTTQPTNQRGV
jgi:two-component system NtrC family sensor kinase